MTSFALENPLLAAGNFGLADRNSNMDSLHNSVEHVRLHTRLAHPPLKYIHLMQKISGTTNLRVLQPNLSYEILLSTQLHVSRFDGCDYQSDSTNRAKLLSKTDCYLQVRATSKFGCWRLRLSRTSSRRYQLQFSKSQPAVGTYV